jgi:hypothetical protein
VRGPLVQLRGGPARPAPDVLAAARANCLDWDWAQGVRQSEGATALLRRLPTTEERLSRSSRSVLLSRHSPLRYYLSLAGAITMANGRERPACLVRWLAPQGHVLLQSSARDRLHLPPTSAERTDCKPSHWHIIWLSHALTECNTAPSGRKKRESRDSLHPSCAKLSSNDSSRNRLQQEALNFIRQFRPR